jgi:hypothetical protein
MTPKPGLTLVTLGEFDYARAKKFCMDIGWTPSSASQDNVAFFDLNGVALSFAHALSVGTKEVKNLRKSSGAAIPATSPTLTGIYGKSRAIRSSRLTPKEG